MGPRIILRGAIPIDSNIGGSGHRPLLREARAHSVRVAVFERVGSGPLLVCVLPCWSSPSLGLAFVFFGALPVGLEAMLLLKRYYC